jgi:phage replication O-like protein O
MTDQEPFTRVPNAILDSMAELGNAELRVLLVIARKTAGYQKECDRISVSQIAAASGLTSRNAQTAITALLGRNLISREPANKQAFCYRLTISLGDTVANHIPSDTISLGDMEPYPVGTRLDKNHIPRGQHKRKDLKKKEKDSRGTRKRDREPPTPAPIRQALADVSLYDMEHGLKAQVIEVNTQAAALWEAAQKQNKTEADVIAGIAKAAEYCKRKAWECKNGVAPTPTVIRKYWRAAFEEQPNGHQPGQPIRPPVTVDRNGHQWHTGAAAHRNGAARSRSVDHVPAVPDADPAARDESRLEGQAPPLLE